MNPLVDRVLNENGNYDIPANVDMSKDDRATKVLEAKIKNLEIALGQKRDEISSLKHAINENNPANKARIETLEKENSKFKTEVELLLVEIRGLRVIEQKALEAEQSLIVAKETMIQLSEANVKLGEENAKLKISKEDKIKEFDNKMSAPQNKGNDNSKSKKK